MEVKMDFDIKPYDGAGCLKLRMERVDIRKCFNNQYKEIKKTPLSQSITDDFGCCHVYYKINDICEAVEFFEREVMFNGQKLIGRPYSEVRNFFETIDNSIDFNDAGFTSLKFGVRVFAPFAHDEPDEPVESIIIFERGYYGK